MSLPYSFKSFHEIDISFDKFLLKLEKNADIKNLSSDSGRVFFSINPILNSFVTDVFIVFDAEKKGIFFEFNLHKLIKISIIIIMVFAFVIPDILRLILFSFIGVIFLYTVTSLHIVAYLRSIFDKIDVNKNSPEELSSEQLLWLQNPDICPACGYRLRKFDSFCPDCRINLAGRRKTHVQSDSRTGFFDYIITYNFSSKKNETRKNSG